MATIYSIPSVSIVEGDNWVTNAQITIERSGDLPEALTEVQFTNGWQVLDEDQGAANFASGDVFSPTSNSIRFEDGETSKTFLVPIIGDNEAETDETVSFVLNERARIEERWVDTQPNARHLAPPRLA